MIVKINMHRFIVFLAIVFALSGCLGQSEMAAEAPISEPESESLPQIPLPSNPEALCNRDGVTKWSQKYPECAEIIYHFDPQTLDCCKSLDSFFGPTATAPYANCFCYKPWFQELEKYEEYSYISWSSILQTCSE